MSGCYLYCLVPLGHLPPAGLTGVGGAEVRGCDVGSFTAWTSDADARPEPSLDGVREHHGVVQVALEEVTPLPVRFGEWAADSGQLLERLRRERERFGTALDALAGALEFGLRVDVSAEETHEANGAFGEELSADGRAYLRQLGRRRKERRAQVAEREALVAELRDLLGAMVRDERPGAGSAGGASVAHLVARDDAEAYARTVDRFRGERPELVVEVLGPWPPYSFAS